MPFIARGGNAVVTVLAGQSIVIGSFGAGNASIHKQSAQGSSVQLYSLLQYLIGSAVTLGPYASPTSLRLYAAPACELEYVVGTAPALTMVPAASSAAPAAITSANAAQVNGSTLSLAAGATLTLDAGAWPSLGAGLTIQVGQSGSATLAFSGGAVKENSSGTSGSSVTLLASGSYALTQSPTGSPAFRLVGGASL